MLNFTDSLLIFQLFLLLMVPICEVWLEGAWGLNTLTSKMVVETFLP